MEHDFLSPPPFYRFVFLFVPSLSDTNVVAPIAQMQELRKETFVRFNETVLHVEGDTSGNGGNEMSVNVTGEVITMSLQLMVELSGEFHVDR